MLGDGGSANGRVANHEFYVLYFYDDDRCIGEKYSFETGKWTKFCDITTWECDDFPLFRIHKYSDKTMLVCGSCNSAFSVSNNDEQDPADEENAA